MGFGSSRTIKTAASPNKTRRNVNAVGDNLERRTRDDRASLLVSCKAIRLGMGVSDHLAGMGRFYRFLGSCHPGSLSHNSSNQHCRLSHLHWRALTSLRRHLLVEGRASEMAMGWRRPNEAMKSASGALRPDASPYWAWTGRCFCFRAILPRQMPPLSHSPLWPSRGITTVVRVFTPLFRVKNEMLSERTCPCGGAPKLHLTIAK